MDNGKKWSNLPQELLRMIGKFMDTRIDVARFRAVCPSWQSSISPPPVISLKLPLRSNDSLKIIPNGYLPLVRRTVYRIEPCEENPNPWTLFGSAPCPSSEGAILFQVEEEEAQGMRLLTPLSGSPIQPPEGLNLLTYGLSEICTYFYFKIPLMMGTSATALRKVVVSCSNSLMANENDYAIMGVDYGGPGCPHRDGTGSLYFYRSGEENWSVIHEMVKGQFHWSGMSDLITYKGKFYVLECRGRIIVIDPLTKKVSTIVPEHMWYSQGYCQMHLVESSGHLLFVGRDWSSWSGGYEELDIFHVYKLDEEEGKWVEIKNLGDQALFVSNCVSFSVSARDYVGYKENCIYYYSDLRDPYEDDNDVLLMFNFEDGSSRLLQPGDVFF